MATVDFRVGGPGPHHRRLRRLPVVHHQGVRHRLPGQPVRPHLRRRHPVQLRGVLRVRDLLHGLRPRRAPSPGPIPTAATASSSTTDDDHARWRRRPGRPPAGGGLPARSPTCGREVDPLDRGDHPGPLGHRAVRPADAAALEHALRIAEAWSAGCWPSRSGPRPSSRCSRRRRALGCSRSCASP